MSKRLIKDVLKTTFPVLLGYLSIGFAFGVMIQSIGFNFLWAAFMSIVIYGGSMQYVAVDILSNGLSLINVAVISLVVQARHMVYGLSLLDKFKNMGKLKPYMIFSITDETYALLATAKAPENTNPKLYYFLIAMCNHIYWIMGSVIGALVGSLLNFNTKGIDFAMTALFIVICTEQILSYPTKLPTIIGFACGLVALLTFGGDNMLIPAIIAIILILFISKNKIVVKLTVPSKDDEMGKVSEG